MLKINKIQPFQINDKIKIKPEFSGLVGEQFRNKQMIIRSIEYNDNVFGEPAWLVTAVLRRTIKVRLPNTLSEFNSEWFQKWEK